MKLCRVTLPRLSGFQLLRNWLAPADHLPKSCRRDHQFSSIILPDFTQLQISLDVMALRIRGSSWVINPLDQRRQESGILLFCEFRHRGDLGRTSSHGLTPTSHTANLIKTVYCALPGLQTPLSRCSSKSFYYEDIPGLTIKVRRTDLSLDTGEYNNFDHVTAT